MSLGGLDFHAKPSGRMGQLPDRFWQLSGHRLRPAAKATGRHLVPARCSVRWARPSYPARAVRQRGVLLARGTLGGNRVSQLPPRDVILWMGCSFGGGSMAAAAVAPSHNCFILGYLRDQVRVW